MIRIRTPVALLAALFLLTVPSAAGAESVNNAVDDLRTHDVTFEQGALTNKDIDELDALTSRRQGDGYVKVVVLAWAVSDFSTTRRFAEGVRSAIGSASNTAAEAVVVAGAAAEEAGASDRARRFRWED